ncbi:thiamine pyrophosphate-dependent enzyme [Streptomyces sp. MMS24-I29]|uniref:thiamine pyrophosphate-dependent enzyme n=1 Tax=Streptomyces sp. MMS24-I29 TaxID=3351480 RepID=UPI003C7A8508
MQNSDFSQSVNAPASLVVSYSISMLLAVNMRGTQLDGMAENLAMGRLTEPFLKGHGVESTRPSSSRADSQLAFARRILTEERRPYALLVRPDEFSRSALPLTKSAAVAAIVARRSCRRSLRPASPSRIAASTAHQGNDSHFFMTCSMGLAPSIGTGLARETRRTTLVVDSDGSLLMNPSGLVAVGAAPALSLVHLVLDDGRYDSTGGQLTPGRTANLIAWARASGIRHTHTFTEEDELSTHLPHIVQECRAPDFVRCIVSPDSSAPPPRVSEDLAEITRRFRRAVTAHATAVEMVGGVGQ